MSSEFPLQDLAGLLAEPASAARLVELRVRAEQLEREAKALREVAAALESLVGEEQPVLVNFESHRTSFEVSPRDLAGPRGPQAVLAVMREESDRTWKVVELKRELLRRGWAKTPKAVEASIKRLRVAGELVSPSYGFYRLPEQSVVRLEGRAA